MIQLGEVETRRLVSPDDPWGARIVWVPVDRSSYAIPQPRLSNWNPFSTDSMSEIPGTIVVDIHRHVYHAPSDDDGSKFGLWIVRFGVHAGVIYVAGLAMYYTAEEVRDCLLLAMVRRKQDKRGKRECRL